MANAKRHSKVVLVDHEEKMSLVDAATFLETIATKLKEEQSFTLTHGEKTHHVKPSSQVELEVKLEERNGKHKLELEIEWKDGVKDQSIKIG